MKLKTGKTGIVLLAALAIEAVNFPCAALALDPGSSTDMPWYLQLLAFQWAVLHAAGLFALDLFERGFSSHAPGPLTPGSLPSPNTINHLNHQMLYTPHRGTAIVIFIGGYVTTALVLMAITFIVKRFFRWKRGLSARTAKLTGPV